MGKKQAKIRFVDRGLITPEEFKIILDSDPTPQNKYVEKLCYFFTRRNKRYYPDVESFVSQVTEYLTKFEELISRNVLEAPFNDINKYLTFDRIISTVNLHWEEIKERDEKKNLPKEDDQVFKDSIVVYEDSEWKVIKPFSWNAMKKIALGAKWCLAYTQPTYWISYFWTAGKHFFVILNKSLNSVNLPDDQKHPLNKVCAEVSHGGELLGLWDAPDLNFIYYSDQEADERSKNFISFDKNSYNNGMADPQRAEWYKQLPDKIKDLIRTPDPDGKERTKVSGFNFINLQHNRERDIIEVKIDAIIITQDNIGKWLGDDDKVSVDFNVFKKYGLTYTGERGITLSFRNFNQEDLSFINPLIDNLDVDYIEIIDCLRIKTLPKFPDEIKGSIKIENCVNLEDISNLPKTIKGSLILKENPKLREISPLKNLKIHKNIIWKDNGGSFKLTDYIRAKILPIYGRIDSN